MARTDLIQLRRGTEAQWQAAEAGNGDLEVLADGEPGLVIDGTGATLAIVIGDTDVEFDDLPRFSPGDGAGAGSSSVIVAQRLITAGDYATGSVGFGWREPFGSAEDAVLDASAGDRLRVTVEAGWGTSGGSDYLDAVIVESGTHIGTGGATGHGMCAAEVSGFPYTSGTRWYTVDPADLDAGQITLRLNTRTSAGRDLRANANQPCIIIVENHGPAA
jgi:hypothetical protein